jgi:hypothetical protein
MFLYDLNRDFTLDKLDCFSVVCFLQRNISFRSDFSIMSNTSQLDTSHSESIGLAELIEKVKEELRTPPATDPIFLVDKVELEIHVAVEKKIKAEGKGSIGGEVELKISVLPWLGDLLSIGKAKVDAELEASTAGELNRQDIHTIKVTLLPLSEEIKGGLYRGDQGSRELD